MIRIGIIGVGGIAQSVHIKELLECKDAKITAICDIDKNRLKVFHDKIKKHLSDEYLYLSEKKDGLENEITQIKVEMEKRDKTLFPIMEKADKRKYFSPLNLSDVEERIKDDKEEELNNNLKEIQKQVRQLEDQINEIMGLLKESDILLQ